MPMLARLFTDRRRAVSVATIVALVAVPAAIAIAHRGYPVTDVELTSRDVWVTNSEQLLAGKLNRQIDELTSSVTAPGAQTDVLQDGLDVFLTDAGAATLDRVDPAFAQYSERISLPENAALSFHAARLAIVEPDSGALWIVDTSVALAFDPATTEPLAELGAGAQAVVAASGTVFAVDPSRRELSRIDIDGTVSSSRIPALGDYRLSAVGDEPVILDRDADALVRADGSSIDLDVQGFQLQQPGVENTFALVASDDALLEVPLGGGDIRSITAGIDAPARDADDVTPPVWLGGCAHGAWAAARVYLLDCADAERVTFPLDRAASGGNLVFRVNRSVIALNDIASGNVWVADDELRLVDNWDEITPPEEEETTEGDQKSAEQSFEDTLAERTEQNRAPTARDDVFGVRPATSTILPTLANDTDPDGDVLIVTGTSEGYATQGDLDVIDGGRALQFTPNTDAAGTFSFRYTVSDGRPGGVAEALVTVTVVPLDQNRPPVSTRSGAVSVEDGQTIAYNVLADWIDPDGDDIYLQGASPTTGDVVRSSPDGLVTFQHTSAQLGVKEVGFVVSDGRDEASGTLTVDVQAAASLGPIGTPDYAGGFIGADIEISPLDNDLSSSGAPLELLSVEALTPGGTAAANVDLDRVTFAAPAAGTFYLQYTLGAGSVTSIGIIRVDVTENPATPVPPIAVRDTVFLRGNETGTVDPLVNDVSPSGRVLGVQTVTVPDDTPFLDVEIVGNTRIRVTSVTALTAPIPFTYTISDGIDASTATISVVPVPPLTTHQAPVAVDDDVTVRAGDIVSVPVLDNDYHPDDVPMRVSPQLVENGMLGLFFVSGDDVRFQAPADPGSYTAVYEVADPYGQTATARVTFVVTPVDEDANRAPAPRPITARVFAGADVTVDVPLAEIDPDGDSTALDGFPQPPVLGDVHASSTSFTYTAFPDKTGTDSFTYRVVDSFGAVGTGTIRIGVIARPSTDLPPSAVDDQVAMRPARVSTVAVLANDSDPNGYEIRVADALDVPDGITAAVVDNQVEIDAPPSPGAFVVGYTLENGRGGVDTASIAVTVTDDAPLQSPTAVDQAVEPEQLDDRDTADVDPRVDATNPGGRVRELEVSLVGPNAPAAEVLPNGRIRVTAGASRQAIGYRLTNTVDELSATAFVIVPAAPDPQRPDPPILRPDLEPQVIGANETMTWDLDDIVFVPSGRAPSITSADSVTALRSDGTPLYGDDDTLRYTPEQDYRGPASITFAVTDGDSADDPTGVSAVLRLPFTVGDPDFRDKAPTFTPPSLSVEAGTTLDFDLRAATAHENPDVVQQVSYSGLGGQTAAVSATITGSTLGIDVPRNARIGSTARLGFTLRYADFDVPGTVLVTVVSSRAPLATTVDDRSFTPRGSTASAPVLQNDVDPFPDAPMRIVDAVVENAASGASVSHSASSVSVRANASFVGDVVVVYTVQDDTGDPTRRVTGRYVVTVWDPPSKMAAPQIAGSGDGSVTIRFQPPGATNGTTLTGYTVRSSPASSAPNCTAGADCTFRGLANGTAYSFFVTANGRIEGSGITTSSPESDASAARKPFAAASAPESASIGDSGFAPATVSMSWSAASSGGGAARYYWELARDGGAIDSGFTTGTSATRGGQSAGTYSARVRTCNEGADGQWGQNPANCSGWTASGGTVVENEPPPPPPPPPAPTNTAVTARTCPEPSTTYNNPPSNADRGCTLGAPSGYIEAGSQVNAICRSQRNGVQWMLFSGAGYQGDWYIRASDTNRSGFSVPDC